MMRMSLVTWILLTLHLAAMRMKRDITPKLLALIQSAHKQLKEGRDLEKTLLEQHLTTFRTSTNIEIRSGIEKKKIAMSCIALSTQSEAKQQQDTELLLNKEPFTKKDSFSIPRDIYPIVK